jgi:hypothetical protein
MGPGLGPGGCAACQHLAPVSALLMPTGGPAQSLEQAQGVPDRVHRASTRALGLDANQDDLGCRYLSQFGFVRLEGYLS